MINSDERGHRDVAGSALETFEIAEFEGIDRNVISPSVAPVRLYNLSPERRGGYRPFGRVDTSSVSRTFEGAIIGYDDAGLIGVSGAFSVYHLVIQPSLLLQFVDETDSLSLPAFIPGGGFHRGRRAFFMLSQLRNSSRVYPSSLPTPTINVTNNTGTNFTGVFRVTALMYVMTSIGKVYVLPPSPFPASTLATGEIVVVNNGRITLGYSGSIGTIGIDYFISRLSDTTSMGNMPTNYIYVGSVPASVNIVIEADPVGYSIGNGLVILGAFDRTPPPAVYSARVWGLPRRTSTGAIDSSDTSGWWDRGTFGLLVGSSAFRFSTVPFTTPNTIMYSERGSVNLIAQDNYITLSLQSSQRITALTVTADNTYGKFGGLLVFGDNETFVIRGDPALDDFSVDRLPMVVGCDVNKRPATLGSATFVIWKNKVFMVQGGVATHISAKIDRPGQTISQVVPDVRTQSIFVVVNEEVVYQYHPLYNVWTNPPITLMPGQEILYPATDSHGIRIKQHTIGLSRYFNLTATGPTPVIEYPMLYFNEPYTRKLFRYVSVNTENVAGNFPTGAITMDYTTNTGQTGTVTRARHTQGMGLFVLPRGTVGEGIKPTFNFTNFGPSQLIKPPIRFEFVTRNKRRR